MSHNCPNCGAPIYHNKVACPYCDTTYFPKSDMNDVSILYANNIPIAYNRNIARLYNEALENMRKHSGFRREV